MSKRTLMLWCILATSTAYLIFFVATEKYYMSIGDVSGLLSPSINLSSNVFFEAHVTGINSTNTETVAKNDTPTVSKANMHDFKSKYIVEPIAYSKSTSTVPGKRKTKILSCFNCPKWFTGFGVFSIDDYYFGKCPYSECRLDDSGVNRSIADLVFFFPTPNRLPSRPQGQIWTFCSWESPVHYGYPYDYSKWKNVFNWTISYSTEADYFLPYHRLAWRATEDLMSDSDYLKIAKSKTKTAAWFVSNCRTQSRRMEYVERMKKIIDIDVYGGCSTKKCVDRDCLKKLNDTYKFYLSFENSFCKDYVTEKLFRNFEDRLQIVPVARGGFDYQKYIPPGTLVDASKFESPEALAKHLKELADDLSRYTAMLKEKDKLMVVDWPYQWCDMCERLHSEMKPKIIPDIKKVTHNGICWSPIL